MLIIYYIEMCTKNSYSIFYKAIDNIRIKLDLFLVNTTYMCNFLNLIILTYAVMSLRQIHTWNFHCNHWTKSPKTYTKAQVITTSIND